jgi:hypothetical protein
VKVYKNPRKFKKKKQLMLELVVVKAMATTVAAF